MSEKAPGRWFEKGSGERTIALGVVALAAAGVILV